MRAIPIAVLIALLSLTPFVGATTTYNDVMPHQVSVVAGPAFLNSNPLLQASKEYDIAAGVGDTISATLTYTDASTTPVSTNDLDLTLLLPSAAPVPLPIPPPDPVGTLTAIATTRVARTTCTDAAAQSASHPLLGGATTESLSFTVPSGGETGNYALIVRGFTLSADQPYTLSITVISGGSDVTATRAHINPNNAGGLATTLITTNPHCQLI